MHYRFHLLQAGTIALDGGGMFGVVPRVLWEKKLRPDDRGRITLAHNCLLLSPETGGPVVLIEAGSGDKFNARMRDVFGLGDRTVETAVREAGVDPGDVRDVVVTHLHFDHVGGLTRLPRPGETPDWRPENDPASPGVCLTFPRARVHVTRREWTDAVANRSVMTRTYLPENVLPLRERLSLLDPPAPSGTSSDDPLPPGRAAAALAPPGERFEQPLPGIFTFLLPGHTWGQQGVLFTDTAGRRVAFVPDVMPTVHHAGPAWSLAYDVEPYTSMVTRRWLLAEAVAGDWLLVLDHEPDTPLVRVREDGRGGHVLHPVTD